MAVALATISTVLSAASGTTPTVTKPTGLAVGDLMIAAFWYGGEATITKTGWTAIASSRGASGSISSLYKVADSSDAAASNFAFTSNFDDRHFGVIYRITGQRVSGFINGSIAGTAADGASASYTGFTPTAAITDCLYLMFVGARTATTASGYAMATSNPTWTEGNDNNQTSNMFAGAYSTTRPQTTATGNFSVNFGSSAAENRGMLIAIAPLDDVTISPSALALSTRLQFLPVIARALSLTASFVDRGNSIWSNVSKNISTWLNQDKN